MANRLKKILSDIIVVNLSAFVSRRLITDNVLVAFELFHDMKNLKQVEGCMTVKLDKSKAYDRIEWDFLNAKLLKFRLDVAWCNRVIECVQSVSFSILINGKPYEFFPRIVGFDRVICCLRIY